MDRKIDFSEELICDEPEEIRCPMPRTDPLDRNERSDNDERKKDTGSAIV